LGAQIASDQEENEARLAQCKKDLERVEAARRVAYDALVAADYPVAGMRQETFNGQTRVVWDLEVWSEYSTRVYLSSAGELIREHRGASSSKLLRYDTLNGSNECISRATSGLHDEVIRKLQQFTGRMQKVTKSGN
jgi:hypothetical protein